MFDCMFKNFIYGQFTVIQTKALVVTSFSLENRLFWHKAPYLLVLLIVFFFIDHMGYISTAFSVSIY